MASGGTAGTEYTTMSDPATLEYEQQVINDADYVDNTEETNNNVSSCSETEQKQYVADGVDVFPVLLNL